MDSPEFREFDDNDDASTIPEIEADEEEPLEITDFSCATAFESLVLEIEEILRKHAKATTPVPNEDGTTAKRAAHRAELNMMFADPEAATSGSPVRSTSTEQVLVEVLLLDAQADHSLCSTFFHPENRWEAVAADLEDDVPPIRQLVILSPVDRTQWSVTLGRQLLSAACSAVDAAGVPNLACFVPMGGGPVTAYQGFSACHTTGSVTRFTVQGYEATPPQCRYLNGLLDLFQLNIGLQSRIAETQGSAIWTCSESSFHIPNFRRDFWMNAIKSENEVLSERTGACVGFGTSASPIAGIDVKMAWNAMGDTDVVDNSVESQLDPIRNPGTSTLLTLVPRNKYEMVGAAAEVVRDAFGLYLAHMALLADEPDAAQHLQTAERCTPAELIVMQDAVFDVDALTVEPAEICALIADRERGGVGESADPRMNFVPNSFFARFAHQSTYLAHPDDVFALWMMVSKELAVRIDGTGSSSVPLSSLLRCYPGVPDLQTNLMNQKLQMIQHCNAFQTRSAGAAQRRSSDDDAWGDEIEFDSIEEGEDRVATPEASPKKESSGKVAEKDNAAVAKDKSPSKASLLLLSTGDVMHLPSAEAVPVTVDMLERRQTDLSTRDKRSRDQDAHKLLLNDMCGFLYANRTAIGAGTQVCFADFIRWHSPRDFIGVDGVAGHVHSTPEPSGKVSEELEASLLSTRMGQADGAWKQLWAQATPRQPEVLFNPAHELTLASYWLQDAVSQEDVLLWSASYIATGAVHKMLSHALLRQAPLVRQQLVKTAAQINAELSWWNNQPMADAEGIAEGKIRVQGMERHLKSMESQLGALIAVHQQFAAAGDDVECTEGLASLLDRLVAGGSETSGSESTGEEGWAASYASTHLNVGVDIPVDNALWKTVFAPRLDENGDAKAPRSRRFWLRCLAERPMHTRRLRQQLSTEAATDGSFRVTVMMREEL